MGILLKRFSRVNMILYQTPWGSPACRKESLKPAVVDLPTPPFPEATAMMSPTPAMEGPPFAKAL